MKKLFVSLVALLSVGAASAQGFNMGDQTVNATIGFGNSYGVPISIGYEKAVYSFATDHLLGVGAQLSLANDLALLAAEANYHYVGFDSFDLYGGIALGTNLTNDGRLFTGMQVGSNYYLNDTWAINLEFGYGLSNVGLGLTYKF